MYQISKCHSFFHAKVKIDFVSLNNLYIDLTCFVKSLFFKFNILRKKANKIRNLKVHLFLKISLFYSTTETH